MKAIAPIVLILILTCGCLAPRQPQDVEPLETGVMQLEGGAVTVSHGPLVGECVGWVDIHREGPIELKRVRVGVFDDDGDGRYQELESDLRGDRGVGLTGPIGGLRLYDFPFDGMVRPCLWFSVETSAGDSDLVMPVAKRKSDEE